MLRGFLIIWESLFLLDFINLFGSISEIASPKRDKIFRTEFLCVFPSYFQFT